MNSMVGVEAWLVQDAMFLLSALNLVNFIYSQRYKDILRIINVTMILARCMYLSSVD